MPLPDTLIRTNLDQNGLKAFGVAMPVISPQWYAGGQATLSKTDLSLTSATNWLAPLACAVRKVDSTAALLPTVTLTQANGAAVNGQAAGGAGPVLGPGLLLTVLPPAYLRLRRLYANLLETSSALNPLQGQGLALRPVPHYFFYAGTVAPASLLGGEVLPGDNLGVAGTLRIFDEHGHIIDPLAVASALRVLLQLHPILTAPATTDQLGTLVGLRAGPTLRVRLVRPDGQPVTATPTTTPALNLQNLTSVQPAAGIFSVNAYTGTDASVRGEILRSASTGATGAFPDAVAPFLLLGLATYGRLTGRVRLPQLPAFQGGATLQHDFFTVRVVDLQPYLLGSPTATPTPFNGSALEPRPLVRLNEVVQLLADGNALLGQLSTLLAGAPTQALVVGEAIADDFPLPPPNSPPAQTRWSSFPALPAGLTAENGPFPADFKAQVQAGAKAQFIASGTATPSVDVLLTLTNVPLGAAVRAYNRRLISDMMETRGDGAGGVVGSAMASPPAAPGFTGTLQLVLPDPLGLRQPDGTYVSPINPTLNVDLVLVQGNLRKRLVGNLTLAIAGGIPGPAPASAVPNLLTINTKRGICLAGIHGLKTTPVTLNQGLLNAALQFLGEGNPRDAPRLPTMARRDLLAAALATTPAGSSWQAALSGGQLTRRLHSADPRAGNPGSKGGPETAHAGLATQNGRLAYDIARAAYRRTTDLYTRLPALAAATWNEPPAPPALPEGSAPTATAGTVAAALLQNLAPASDTPELALLKQVVDDNLNQIPRSFDALVNWLLAQINGLSVAGLPGPLATAANNLRTKLTNWLNGQKDGNALNESQKQRLVNELLRELATACYGRRDSLWALEAGINSAREFIYIETPGFGATQYGADTNYSKDLLALLKKRLDQQPGLHVMICVPRRPEYAPGYANFLRQEVAERLNLLVADAAAGNPTALLPESRVVVFHPMGFPGRASLLEAQVVIVDDAWALVGSSSLRRRGLTFDGSTDVVLTDADVQNGVSPAIRNFRLALMQQRLALGPSDRTTLNNAAFSRLQRGRDAFYAIRDLLIDGGYGVLERLWDGRDPHTAYVAPTTSPALWNPEGQEFSALSGGLLDLLASISNEGGSL